MCHAVDAFSVEGHALFRSSGFVSMNADAYHLGGRRALCSRSGTSEIWRWRLLGAVRGVGMSTLGEVICSFMNPVGIRSYLDFLSGHGRAYRFGFEANLS